MGDGRLILLAGALLTTGLAASLVAGRLRLPALLLFLAIGMGVGSEGLGWIEFDDYELARRIGIIALALILFEGGLTAGFAQIRDVLRPAIGLALIGTALTAVLAGLAAAWLLGLTLLQGLLLGAILASTDSAAIFALLRGSTLRRRLAVTLEAEAGLNDPVAVLLVLGFIEWIQRPDWGPVDMAELLARQLGIGLAVGAGVGWVAVQALRRARLDSPGLYPVASVAAAAVAFGAADALEGSGFLAVYLTGLALGSATVPAKRSTLAFHDGVAWTAQIALFLTLGLLVFPSQLADVALEGTVLGLVVVVVARPLAAAVAVVGAGFDLRERVLLGWAGLRGAVPVVLATFPVIAGVPESARFFNLVFFAVVISTLLQGATFEPLARVLGMTTDEPALPRPLSEIGTIRRLGAEIVEYPVASDDAIVGRRIRELGLPREALVNVIVRAGQALPPRGSTRVQPGDELHVLLRQEVAGTFPQLLERWRSGPWEPVVPRRPPTRAAPVIFSARPWDDSDGDPAAPRILLGTEVIELLRTRADRAGALVALADGRYAVTGRVLAVGAAGQLRRYARTRLVTAATEDDRAWWRETIGALVV